MIRVADVDRTRLKVIYLDHCAQLSGGELALLRLLPALAVDAHVILAEEGPLVKKFRDAGISCEVLSLERRSRELHREEVRLRRLPIGVVAVTSAYTVTLARRLRQLRPDLIHTNSLKSTVYGLVAGRLAGIPVICHIRDRIDNDYLPAWAASTVRFLIARLSSGIVANSASTMATLKLDPRRPQTWIVRRAVIYDPVIAHARRRRLPDGIFRVAMVGRIAPWKGQDIFLRAFAKAFEDGSPARAVIVGSPLFGEEVYESRLKSLIIELGIGDRVSMMGFSDDIPAILQQVDCLVHASVLPEPFGQVVAEGMSAGLPVIASDAGGPPELISDGITGLLHPPGDVAALATALRRLQADPILAVRLGHAARQVVSDITPDAVAGRMMDVYAAVQLRQKIASRASPTGWP